MKVTIYHNPRCSKSRQALDILISKGIEPEIVEYLKTPPSATEIRRLLKQLHVGPREILRNKEAAEFGLADPALSDEALIAGLSRHPQALERPIVVAGNKAVLGRPPEAVLSIL
ncbi:MAG: arsenate reductase (glutaredoxin) [Alphaproteobacteria bacterium]|nr:arsenate reductase (glutaredoxin) [Alphaproteobacteria bacterium]